MDDLFNAIKLFNGSMQELATNVAVQDARSQVQQINATVTKEGEKRQALQGLANDLALRLSGAGAPATTIQSAFQAVAPEAYATPEQAQFASQLQGADSLAGAAEQGIAAGQGRMQAKSDMELKADLIRMREQARLNKESLEMRMSEAPKGKELRGADLQYIGQSDEAKLRAGEILNTMKEKKVSFGPVASRVPFRDMVDEDFAVFQADIKQFFDAYRKEITGAGASNEELKSLEKSLVQATEPPAILEAKLKRIMDLAAKKKKLKLKLFKQGKYDVSGFEEGTEGATEVEQTLSEGNAPAKIGLPSLKGYIRGQE